MASKVAVEGEAVITASPGIAKGADSGSWKAGTPSYTSYSKLKSGSKKVIWKVQCTFSFTGKAGNSGFTTQETVTLTATTKKLNKSQNKVLVDGDSKISEEGNKIAISASGKLTAS